MKIGLAADHRGFEMKERIKAFLKERGIEFEDFGAYDKKASDYPDFARRAAVAISEGNVGQGIMLCGTGLGMSIAANKAPRVRAALCLSAEMARMARVHNNANVLVMSADNTPWESAVAIMDAWLKNDFEGAVRHKRRIRKIHEMEISAVEPLGIYDRDPETYAAVMGEAERQSNQIVLIASESLASRAVREAQGSVLTNKYAEGYPGKRWYNGCQFMDEVEQLAIDRAKQLFGAEHANVQPHCGSSANMAVFFAALEPGDTIMAMKLAHGGHLTHGHSVNFSGRFFNVVPYGVSEENEQIDYDNLAEIAAGSKPKMIVAGASAYSRIIDFKRLRNIADGVGAYLMVDMAHIAGLVAGGCHPNPTPFAEFVTATTHKTLCGPRGGLILCRARFAEDIDRQVFPGVQGGPLMHVVAAKAVCFYEAIRPAFRKYQEQVVKNAKALAAALSDGGLRIVSGGTDNHLALVDLTPAGATGRDAAAALEKVGITVNKNAIPFDKKSPFVTSGIRVGTPIVTARGMGEKEMRLIGDAICRVVKHISDESVAAEVRKDVVSLVARFPIP